MIIKFNIFLENVSTELIELETKLKELKCEEFTITDISSLHSRDGEYEFNGENIRQIEYDDMLNKYYKEQKNARKCIEAFWFDIEILFRKLLEKYDIEYDFKYNESNQSESTYLLLSLEKGENDDQILNDFIEFRFSNHVDKHYSGNRYNYPFEHFYLRFIPEHILKFITEFTKKINIL